MRSMFAKITRDLILWSVGVAGIVQEVFFNETPNPTKLGFCAFLCQLPLALRWDEQRRTRRNETDN